MFAAGSAQEVPHFHLHVVPRRKDSDWGFGPPHIARLERRPPHLDYAVVTDAKLATVDLLRKRYREHNGVASVRAGEASEREVNS